MHFVHTNYQGSIIRDGGVPEELLHPIPEGMTFSPYQDTPVTILSPHSNAGNEIISVLEGVRDRNFLKSPKP